MSRSIRPREQGQVKVQPFASVGKRRPSAKAGNNRRRNTLPDLDILEARTLLSTVTAQLIKDVNSVDSFPSNLTPAGSNLFSLVEDSTGSGPELEVTSSAGVSQGLLDFSTNSTSGPRSPSDLTPVGNNVYFLARSASSTSTYQDDELWMSDGTAGGTVQVSIPDPNINYFTFLTAVGNTAIVALEAGNTTDDYQAWAIPPGNGTPTMLADFGNVALSTVGEVGGTLYLSVGSDLWTTDGTQANTQEVTGSGGAPIVGTENVFAFNNKTYAFSDVGTQTTIGTLGASGVTPIVTVSSASSPVVVGSKFYFAGGSGDSYSASQLWVSDGTSAGTQMLDDFSSISSSSRPSSLTAAGADLFFTVAGADGLDELWMSTGTSQGTVHVKDLGISPSFSSYSGYSYYGYGANQSGSVAAVGGTLFFTADDGTHGAELWADTIATGTLQLVQDIDPGASGSDPHDFVTFNNGLYFAAHDGSTPQANQLWMSDGPGQATSLVASFSPGATAGAATFDGYNDSDYGTLGSQIFLSLNDGVHGTALWVTNGTTAGTTLLAELEPSVFATLGNTEYFLATGTFSSSQRGLWKTDGTVQGTVEVKGLTGTGSSYGYGYGSAELVATGGKLFFTTGDGNGGNDLWVSNGTQAGTVVVKDFTKASSGTSYGYNYLSELTALGGKLAFVADDGTHGGQVWASDGTAAGTVMLTTVDDTPTGSSTDAAGADPGPLTVAGGELYFFADTPSASTAVQQQGLWKSDGTPGGTSEIITIPTLPVAGNSSGAVADLASLTVVGSELFFAATYDYYNGVSDTSDTELWVSDGTAANTVQVLAPSSAAPLSTLSSFSAVGSDLLFQAKGSSGDLELWASNGTTTGTTLLKVLNPGTGYSYSYNYSGDASLLTNGVLYFAANDGTHGDELWESNGTAAGTYLVDDINPGSGSSNPAPLAVVSGQLVLVANDGIHGGELMNLVPTSQPVAPASIAIPTQQVTVGQTLTLDVSPYVYDADSAALPLHYSLGADAPAGATINPATGILVWPTTAGQATGSSTFTVVVADSENPALSVTDMVTVSVDPVSAPVFATDNPEPTVVVGNTLTFNVSLYASDPNFPALPLAYSLSSAPTGALINPSTGVITWAPTSTQVTGPVSFTVIASDNSEPALTASHTFTVYVETDSPPALDAIPTQYADIGQMLTLRLSNYVYSFTNPPLTYALSAGAPAGASIDPTSGILTFTPTAGQALGSLSIGFTATDSGSTPLSISGSITVDVAAAGSVRSPVLDAPPTIAQRVVAGQTLTLDISQYASDPNDPALTLTYSLGAGAPAGATIDATTGEITWATAANQALEAYLFPVTVTDTSTPVLSATQTYIADVVPSYSISYPTLGQIPSQEANVGSTFQFNLSPYAADNNTPPLPLSYSLGSEAPTGVTINAQTGLITWAIPADATLGETNIPVIVSDYLTPPETATQNLNVQLFAVGATLPPTVSFISSQSAAVGQQLQINVGQYVSNPAQLTLTYSLDFNPPVGASIDPVTGVLTWTPTASELGSNFIDISISNGETDPISTSVFVNVSQYAGPTLAPIAAQSATIDQPFSLDVSSLVTDPNSAAYPLTYSLSGSSYFGGPAIDPTTGLLTWTPSSYGTSTYTVTVADSQSPPVTASQTFTITVAALPPTLQPIPAQSATVGKELQFSVSQYATDPSFLGLNYSLAPGAPAGATISQYGEFTWTPAANQPAGPAVFTLIVSDDGSPPQTVSETFTVNVAAAPIAAPTIASIPAEIATTGKTFTFNASTYASDTNTPMPTLSFSLGAGAPAGASINATTGILTWTPAGNLTPGSYPFTVDVADNLSPQNITVAGFTVVLSTTSVLPPALTQIPTTSATIGQPLSLNLSQYASDPNTPALTLSYALSGTVPAGATLNATSGVLSWTPAANQATGNTAFTVVVSDTNTPALTTSETFQIDVVSTPTLAPVVGAFPAQTAIVGQAFSFQASPFASDPNTPELTLSYHLGTGAPTGATINATTGVLTWTPAAGQATGPATFTIIVTDSAQPPLSTAATLTVNVFAAPVIQTIPTQTATVGTTFTLNVGTLTTDPNKPARALSYQLGGTVPAGATIDPTSGIITWAVPADAALGDVAFTVTATETTAPTLSESQTVTVDVFATVVKAPAWTAIPGQSATIGQPFSFNVSSFASDPNSPPLTLTYALGSGAPAGASVSATTGLITWTPSASQPTGPVNLTIIASDTNSPPLTASATLTVTVKPAVIITVNPPTISAVPTQSVNVGQALALNLGAFTADSNTPALPVTYSLAAGAPAGVNINSATGVLNWSVSANQQIGTYPITIAVADNGSPQRTASTTFNITVTDPSPVTISSATVTTKKGFAITLTFSGPVNASTASNAANYTLTAPAKKSKSKKKPTPPPKPIRLSVTFNAATNQVILKGPKTVKTSPALTLTVFGTGSAGVAKLDGLLLAGSGAQAGTNYVASVTTKAVRAVAAVVAAPGARSAQTLVKTTSGASERGTIERASAFFRLGTGAAKSVTHPLRFASYFASRSMPRG